MTFHKSSTHGIQINTQESRSAQYFSQNSRFSSFFHTFVPYQGFYPQFLLFFKVLEDEYCLVIKIKMFIAAIRNEGHISDGTIGLIIQT